MAWNMHFSLNMQKSGSIGIDVGGTKTLFALFNDQFQVLEEVKVRTVGTTQTAFAKTLKESVASLLKKASKQRVTVSAIGVGCAGSVDPEKGVVNSAPNIPALDRFSFNDALADVMDVRVRLSNDVHAAFHGEHRLGAAVGCEHLIGIFLGTGIGGAIIIDGKLYLGAGGHAGNIGHYLLQPLGPLAGSDRGGQLDSIASRAAIAGEAAALATKRRAPYLLDSVGTDVKKITSTALADAIDRGDKDVEELVRNRAQILGIILSNMVDFLNPEMIVLGGGLVDAMPDIITQEVAAGIKLHATPEAQQALQIVASKLKSHAVTTGAAKLAVDSL